MIIGVFALVATFVESGPANGMFQYIYNFENLIFYSEPLSFENNPFIPDERRYSQFKAMFQHFYTNEQLAKTYGYGCYCLNLGDRPLAGIMTGRTLYNYNIKYNVFVLLGVVPVDSKDMHCFQFIRCNRCVAFDYGPDCTPEQIAYDVSILILLNIDTLFSFLSLILT